MKKIGMIFTALFMLFVASCNDDDDDTYSLDVTVNYPDNYKSSVVRDAKVYVTEEGSSRIDSVLTNEEGLATFPSLSPGNYKITVSKILSAPEAEEETGVAEEVTLTAIENGVTVVVDTKQSVTLAGTVLGSLVFKEVYYTGSKTVEDKSYFSDQYYEIYNNSTEVIYADKLCLGVVDAWAFKPTLSVWLDAYPNQLAIQSFWYVPGSGTDFPINPGESIIIAQDGIDHKTDPLGNPNSPVNLSDADWEVFVPRDDNKDIDVPTTPNMEFGYATFLGFDWLTSVFGSGFVLFRIEGDIATYVENNKVTKPESTSSREYVLIDNTSVIDGFQAYNDDSETGMPKLHPVIDAGFTFDPNGTYTGKCVRRKVKDVINGRTIYQDTNNSTNDFLNDQECQPRQN